MAQISPMCSTIVARAMGTMKASEEMIKEASPPLKSENTVSELRTGRPIHAA